MCGGGQILVIFNKINIIATDQEGHSSFSQNGRLLFYTLYETLLVLPLTQLTQKARLMSH